MNIYWLWPGAIDNLTAVGIAEEIQVDDVSLNQKVEDEVFNVVLSPKMLVFKEGKHFVVADDGERDRPWVAPCLLQRPFAVGSGGFV